MSKRKTPIYQLANFKIDEVSLVDRGANKQRFVVIKRETGMQEQTEQQEQHATETVLVEGGEAPNMPSPAEPTPRQEKEVQAGPKAHQEVNASVATDGIAGLPDTLALLRELVSTLKIRGDAPVAAANTDMPAPDAATAVSKIEKRLEKLEKHFCLPNSMTGEALHAANDGHVWPFDLNTDRAKV